MGGFKRRITTPDFRGGEITAIMGGCDLDLRQSSINGVAVLNVFAMCGGITIKVPVDWTVELDGTPIMGGFEEKTIVPPTRRSA
jgi:predicted membrane protein